MDDPYELTTEDTALIAEEEDRYARCARRVREALRAKTYELTDDEKLARKLTAELVAEKREEEKQFLQSDEKVAHALARLRHIQAGALSELARQPYFARVVCREGGRDVEFRLGVAGFPEERIVDWRRAPLSRLYYDFEEGEHYDDEIAGVERRGTIVLKRAYRGREDGLTGIEMNDLSFAKSRGRWAKFRKSSRTLFSLKDKERARRLMAEESPLAWEQVAREDGYLAQILSLITPEQFRLIGLAPDRPVVIQGSAGTGKTTVALHRLAWLTFDGEGSGSGGKIHAELCLVVMPTPALAAYVANVLPALGAGDVRVATYADVAKDTALPPARRRFPQELDHLVVDEAQDFLPGELKSLVSRLRDRSHLTIAGDIAQRIREGRCFASWNELMETLGLNFGDVLNLNVAYRSTYQIHEVAEFVRDPNLPEEGLKMSPRFGPDPVLTICHNEDEAVETARAWIEDVYNLDQRVTAAVVCRRPDEAARLFNALKHKGVHGIRRGGAEAFEFTPGITVTDSAGVKGLEFPCVLIFNPSNANYPPESSRERNLLYVAASRALYRLDFIAWGDVTPMLPESLVTRDLTIPAEGSESEEEALSDLLGEWRREEAEAAGGEGEAEPGEPREDAGEPRDMVDEMEKGVAEDDENGVDDEGGGRT